MVLQIEMDAPTLAQKHAMYQELRVYVRSLLDCLNEKVAEINGISDRRRLAVKARTERLLRRRRRDVQVRSMFSEDFSFQDQYAECSAAASGKSINSVRSGDHATRAAERDARRCEFPLFKLNLSHFQGAKTSSEGDVVGRCVA